MPRKSSSPPSPPPDNTGPRLHRIVAYCHADELQALKERARRERVSQGEIVRRSLRKYLRIED